jgi:hypothetical protein
VTPAGYLLVQAIGAGLSTLGPALTHAPNDCDLFELYLLTEVVEAARSLGGTIEYRTVEGDPATQFVCRTSPGHIYSTARSYTHALISLPMTVPPRIVEAHVGVFVAGSSKVPHECDVAVIEHAEAQRSRALKTDPRSSKLIVAVEAKFYADRLPLHMGRGFVGLQSDLAAKFSTFVFNTTSESVSRLLAARTKGRGYDDVMVGTPAAFRLRSHFANALRHHCA